MLSAAVTRHLLGRCRWQSQEAAAAEGRAQSKQQQQPWWPHPGLHPRRYAAKTELIASDQLQQKVWLMQKRRRGSDMKGHKRPAVEFDVDVSFGLPTAMLSFN
jgi:hypothetical protein